MKHFASLILLLVAAIYICAQPAEIPSGNASIAGRVTLEEKPLAGAVVNLSFANRSNGPMRTTKTDTSGKFKFEGLGTGAYLLAPHAMAYVFAEQSSFQPFPGRNLTVSADEQVTDVHLALTRGGVITGKITDADGRPVIEQRVQLNLKDAQGRAVMRPRNFYEPMISLTDDRGMYRIFGLAPGKYTVRVGDGETSVIRSDVGQKRYAQTFYPGVATEAESKTVEVVAGEEATDIDIRLSREKQTYAARGRVVDSQTSKPVASVRIGIGRLGRNGSWLSMSTAGSANVNGEFVVPGLVTGNYLVYIEDDQQSEFYTEGTPFEITDADVNGLQINVQRGGSISGTITIQGATTPDLPKIFSTLFVRYSARERSFGNSFSPPRVNPDGTFQLKGIKPGNGELQLGSFTGESQVMLIRVERDGVPLSSGLTINAGETVQGIRIIAGVGAGAIRGQVIVQGGALAPDARMFVSARLVSSQQGFRSTPVDVRGTFLLEKLMPGEYELTLSPPMVAGQPPPPPSARKIVKQRVIVGATGETSVTMTLDLTPQGGQQ